MRTSPPAPSPFHGEGDKRGEVENPKIEIPVQVQKLCLFTKAPSGAGLFSFSTFLIDKQLLLC